MRKGVRDAQPVRAEHRDVHEAVRGAQVERTRERVVAVSDRDDLAIRHELPEKRDDPLRERGVVVDHEHSLHSPRLPCWRHVQTRLPAAAVLVAAFLAGGYPVGVASYLCAATWLGLA